MCGGTDYVVAAPNLLRCTNQAIVNAVAPGLNGNTSGVPIPIWGEWGTTDRPAAWRAAADQAAATEAAAQEAREREAAVRQRLADLEKRKKRLLADLAARGNSGIQSRLVPGRYHLSFAARFFGRPGRDVLVAVSPAWRFGTCTWLSSGMRGVDVFENLATRITPKGHVVPMKYAAPDEDVEMLYRGRSLWTGTPAAPYGLTGRPVSIEDVVRALEAAATG